MSPSPTMSPTISVVIPALNEEANLPLVLEGLPPVDEVVVVDGGSSDGTVAAVLEARPDAIVVRQTRTGKGNALVCGFAASTGDIVITLDSSGRADPGELTRHVRALQAGAEATHGSRFRSGGGDLAGRPGARLVNAFLCWLVNLLFGTRFTDLGTSYNGFWRESFTALDLPAAEPGGEPANRRRRRTLAGDGPEIVPLIAIRMAAQGLRVVEVASTAYPPIHGGRRRSRGMRSLRTLLSEWRRQRRLKRRPSPPARHDADTHPGYATSQRRPYPGRPPVQPPRSVCPATPDPSPRVAGELSTGRHSRSTQDLGTRHSGIYGTQQEVHRTGVYDTAVRRSGLYDTGVHRLGVYDSGVHRTDVYDSGVHELPDPEREVGGGRRRLDARDRDGLDAGA